MPVTAVTDAGFGDSGKGKVLAFLAQARGVRHIVDGGTGPSAGHVLTRAGRTHTLSAVPPGFFVDEARLYVGPGTLVDEGRLRSELVELADYRVAERLTVDFRCGLIPEHAVERERQEGLHDLGLRWEAGTTAARVDYLWRRARRFGDIADSPCLIGDVVTELNAIARDEEVLVLGAHGPAFSLFTSDNYPLTTSDNCSAAAVMSRTGIAWRHLQEVVAVVNMLPTVTVPVPLSHELPLDEVRRRGLESFGAVSGVRRRVAAQPDLEQLRRFVLEDQPTSLVLGRADEYDPECRGARRPSELPASIRRWADYVEDEVGVPVLLVSTGPAVEDMVELAGSAVTGGV